jgi:hypothetical protein
VTLISQLPNSACATAVGQEIAMSFEGQDVVVEVASTQSCNNERLRLQQTRRTWWKTPFFLENPKNVMFTGLVLQLNGMFVGFVMSC